MIEVVEGDVAAPAVLEIGVPDVDAAMERLAAVGVPVSGGGWADIGGLRTVLKAA